MHLYPFYHHTSTSTFTDSNAVQVRKFLLWGWRCAVNECFKRLETFLRVWIPWGFLFFSVSVVVITYRLSFCLQFELIYIFFYFLFSSVNFFSFLPTYYIFCFSFKNESAKCFSFQLLDEIDVRNKKIKLISLERSFVWRDIYAAQN